MFASVQCPWAYDLKVKYIEIARCPYPITEKINTYKKQNLFYHAGGSGQCIGLDS